MRVSAQTFPHTADVEKHLEGHHIKNICSQIY